MVIILKMSRDSENKRHTKKNKSKKNYDVNGKYSAKHLRQVAELQEKCILKKTKKNR